MQLQATPLTGMVFSPATTAHRNMLCRELKRIDSLAMSPIFGHFGETVHGLLTLRAFRGQERFVAHNRTLVNASNRAYWGIQEVSIVAILSVGSLATARIHSRLCLD